MLTKTEKSFSFLFAFLLTIEIVTSSFAEIAALNYLAKPALLTSLIFFFWKQSKQIEKNTRIMILCALIFSLIGDILLMFVNLSGNYFIGGLLAFLTAHIFYVLVF